MSNWTCRIPGEPVAWGRAGIDFKRRRVFTAPRSATWKAHAVTTMHERRDRPRRLACPVVVQILAVFKRPKRLQTKATRDTFAPHVSKPDADNLAKATCDALQNAEILKDDSVAYDVRVIKRHADEGEQPCVIVTLEWDSALGVPVGEGM